MPLIVIVAYTMFGATGFGSSIIAVPALAHAFPLTFAVPFVTALDGAATATASRAQWRDAAWVEIRRILPSMLFGIALGATLLVNLPRGPALLALGVFVAAYGAWQLLGARTMTRAPVVVRADRPRGRGVLGAVRHRRPDLHGLPLRAHPRQDARCARRRRCW